MAIYWPQDINCWTGPILSPPEHLGDIIVVEYPEAETKPMEIYSDQPSQSLFLMSNSINPGQEVVDTLNQQNLENDAQDISQTFKGFSGEMNIKWKLKRILNENENDRRYRREHHYHYHFENSIQ